MKNNQTENDINNAINLFLRKMAIIFISFVLVMFIGFAILFTINDSDPIKYFLYLYAIQHIMLLVGIIYFKDISIETSIRFYLCYIITALYPIVCICWNTGDPVVFFWYMLVLIGASVFDMRHIKIWIFITVVVIISVFFFSSSLFSYKDVELQVISVANILTIIAVALMTSFFAIVFMKKTDIEKSMHTKELQTYADNAENLEKYMTLYNNIIEYLEKDKPFRDPDFSPQALAKALNSNIIYISRAINVGSGNNFNALLNSFRIGYVKSMLDCGAIKKYTIDYIYAEAGYKYRSTFNSAFKLITGTTPSDYVSRQNANNNS